MGIYATYWVDCDLCGDGTDSSHPTQEYAWDYAERGGWWVFRGRNAAVCEDCYDETKVYHVQASNTFCVLCQSGEHIAIIK